MKKLLFLVFVVIFLTSCAGQEYSLDQIFEPYRSAVDQQAVIDSLGDDVHVITVAEDGTFSPQQLSVAQGDTVAWVFNDRTDSIVSVSAPQCDAYNPYSADDFTGPKLEATSGIFLLGPQANKYKGAGLVVENKNDDDASCSYKERVAEAGDYYLCSTGERFYSMDPTWEHPDVTGIFIRPWWKDINTGPGEYDWTIIDHEIERAVASGKVYSLSFKAGSKGTPDWLFTTDDHPVKKITFQDGADNYKGCGSTLHIGSPMDPNYQYHYFKMLEDVAAHIKEKNAWYRNLAYIKPSGANLFTSENRLPKRCDEGCHCNPQIWAEQGDYTPEGLYDFYSKQTAILAEAFPEKDMAYMLIQGGFPLVNNYGEWEEPLTEPLPKGVEQTETIIKQGIDEHGTRFVVQHNGLGPMPQDRFPKMDPCPNEGVHPAAGPYPRAGSGCPNQWTLKAGIYGTVTGFQTNNNKAVGNPEELESTLRNAWVNSDAVFVEIYEEVFWEAEIMGQSMDVSVGQWAEMFHDRRRQDWSEIPEPFPEYYMHTFDSAGEHYYVHGSACDEGEYGKIVVS